MKGSEILHCEIGTLVYVCLLLINLSLNSRPQAEAANLLTATGEKIPDVSTIKKVWGIIDKARRLWSERRAKNYSQVTLTSNRRTALKKVKKES
jgi:hypothetical protein